VSAALRAFGHRGYHDTQISNIIQEAQVARGTFYLYFKSKREIFDALITEISEKVQQVIQPIHKENILEIPEQILGNIERATDLLLNHPLYIKIFFSDAVGLDSEFDDRLRQFYETVLVKIRKGIEHGQALGILREGDPQVLALCLLGTLKETLYHYVLGTYRPSPKKIVQEVYQMVLHAAVKPDLVSQMVLKQTASN
jgi:AcrR family transcriptional regulator